MVVEELSASEGFGSSGMVDVAFVVIPVKVSGNYKITADVTIDEHYNTGTTGGLFLGVYDSYEKDVITSYSIHYTKLYEYCAF